MPGSAYAPYNFVSLPENFFLTTLDDEQWGYPKKNCYDPSRFTGSIDLELKSLTEIFIRNGLLPETVRFINEYTPKHKDLSAKKAFDLTLAEWEVERNHLEETDPNRKQIKRLINNSSSFFSPGGKYRIPASSLRGMIRNIYEVITDSIPYKIDFDEDDYFFWRDLGGKHPDFNHFYRPSFIPKKAKAGFMNKDSNIYPASEYYKVKSGTITLNRVGVNGQTYFDKCEFDWFLVSFQEGTTSDDFKIQDFKTNLQGWKTGWLVCSGDIHQKRHHWIVEIPSQIPEDVYTVSDDFLKKYQKDLPRTPLEKMNFNLFDQEKFLDYLDNNKNQFFAEDNELFQKIKDLGLPCFFLQPANGEVPSFGHTPHFRIPYKHTFAEMLPEEVKHKPDDQFDCAELLFGTVRNSGNTKAFAGRVFFEDAFLTYKPNVDKAKPKILASPKVTCFAHYLKPKKTSSKNNKRRTYNSRPSETTISGTKFYWHHSKNDIRWKYDDWEHPEIEEPKNTKESQYTLIKPLPADTKFRTRIRFENLTSLELGALLTAIQLPDGFAHKLGMAKPLGLGSIQLNITSLRLRCPYSDEPTLPEPDQPCSEEEKPLHRYEKLFSGNQWNTGEAVWRNQESINSVITEFQEHFQKWYLQNRANKPNPTAKDFWKLPRIQELKTLLSLNSVSVNDHEKVKYMPPNLSRGEQDNRSKGLLTAHYGEYKMLPTATEFFKPESES